MKPPSMEQCARWIKSSFDALDDELFTRSFTNTFLNTAVNELHMIRHSSEDFAQNIISLINSGYRETMLMEINNDVDTLDLVDDEHIL